MTQTANSQARPSILSDWNAVEEMINQAARLSANQEQTNQSGKSFTKCDDPALNLAQAQADLLTLLDQFTEGISPVPFLLELVQVWSLSECCDMTQRVNQKNLRSVLNLVSYLTEIRESYNNYAFFLEQVELSGGAEHES